MPGTTFVRDFLCWVAGIDEHSCQCADMPYPKVQKCCNIEGFCREDQSGRSTVWLALAIVIFGVSACSDIGNYHVMDGCMGHCSH